MREAKREESAMQGRGGDERAHASGAGATERETQLEAQAEDGVEKDAEAERAARRQRPSMSG